MTADPSHAPFEDRINPVDPGLSPDVGRERRRLILPISIVVALAAAAAAWWAISPRGPRPATMVFESPDLGCRFSFSSNLVAGPNFVRGESGSLMTIERHSLFEAEREFVAGLPDVLFPQVLIQLDENYADVEERSRRQITLGGRRALEVILAGKARSFGAPTRVTIVIAATEDWAYVLRGYWEETLDAEERELYRDVFATWQFL